AAGAPAAPWPVPLTDPHTPAPAGHRPLASGLGPIAATSELPLLEELGARRGSLQAVRADKPVSPATPAPQDGLRRTAHVRGRFSSGTLPTILRTSFPRPAELPPRASGRVP